MLTIGESGLGVWRNLYYLCNSHSPAPTPKAFYMLGKHSAIESWAISRAQFFQLKTAQYVNFIFKTLNVKTF